MRAINDTHSAATQLRPDVVSVRKPLPDHLPSMKKQANSCKSKWRVCGMRKASAVKALGSTDPNGYESCNDRPRLYGMYSSAPDRTRNDPRNHTKSHEQRLLCFVYLVGSSYLPGKSLKIGTPPNSYDCSPKFLD